MTEFSDEPTVDAGLNIIELRLQTNLVTSILTFFILLVASTRKG